MEFKRILSDYMNLRGTLFPVVQEAIRLFPDGLIVGTGIYSFLTLSFPFAIFFGSLLESLLVMYGLQRATNLVNLNSPVVAAHAVSDQCRSGVSSVVKSSFSALAMFSMREPAPQFPSPPLYILAVASAYIFNTLNMQAKELQALGPAYSSRYYVSFIFLLLLLLFFLLFRLSNSCDTLTVALFTTLVGLAVGTILVIQNNRLFGQNSINLIGVPLLRNRSANGKLLYLCPK